MSPTESRNDRERRIWDDYLSGPVSQFPTNGSTDDDRFRDWAVNFVLSDHGISVDETLDATTIDGSGDKGLDGWYVSENGDAHFVLNVFQAKNTRVRYEDIVKLVESLGYLYNPESTIRETANSELLSRVVEFESILANLSNSISVAAHIVTSKTATASVRNQVSDYDGTVISLGERQLPLNVQIFDGGDFVERLTTGETDEISWEFSVEGGSYAELTPSGSFKTVLAAVSAQELADLFHRHGIALFKLNPRFTLGTRTNTNAKIMDTLLGNDKAHFFHYNNGVTILCSSLSVNDRGSSVRVSVGGVQIVNGCQTTASLEEVAYQRGQNLRDVPVNVRLIESGMNETIAHTIATTTNDQNPLRAEDSRSNEKVNTRLAAQFKSMHDPWFYEYKRGMWRFADAAGDTDPYKQGRFSPRRVGLKDLAQAALAFNGQPDEAADRSRFIFEHKSKFDSIFVLNVQAPQLLLPTILYRAAQERAKKEKQDNGIEWALNLRFPLVAVTGGILRWLRPLAEGETYYEGSLSAQLIDKSDQWIPEIFDDAFLSLASHMRTNVDPATGVRSLVRRREYLEPVITFAKQTIERKIQIERQYQSQLGGEVDIGLLSSLPENFVTGL